MINWSDATRRLPYSSGFRQHLCAIAAAAGRVFSVVHVWVRENLTSNLLLAYGFSLIHDSASGLRFASRPVGLQSQSRFSYRALPSSWLVYRSAFHSADVFSYVSTDPTYSKCISMSYISVWPLTYFSLVYCHLSLPMFSMCPRMFTLWKNLLISMAYDGSHFLLLL